MRQPLNTSAIYEDLKNKIMKGEIRSGEFLFETQIAQTYGVSRTPARQAIKLLEEDGLLVSVPRKGNYVKFLGSEEVINVYQTAQALEGMAVQLLSGKREYDCSKLIEYNAQMREALKVPDITLWCQLDESFHEEICHNCGNEIIERFYSELKINMRRVRVFYVSLWHDKNHSCEEHDELIRAIHEGNVDLGREIIYQHYQSVLDNAVNVLNLTPTPEALS